MAHIYLDLLGAQYRVQHRYRRDSQKRHVTECFLIPTQADPTTPTYSSFATCSKLDERQGKLKKKFGRELALRRAAEALYSNKVPYQGYTSGTWYTPPEELLVAEKRSAKLRRLEVQNFCDGVVKQYQDAHAYIVAKEKVERQQREFAERLTDTGLLQGTATGRITLTQPNFTAIPRSKPADKAPESFAEALASFDVTPNVVHPIENSPENPGNPA